MRPLTELEHTVLGVVAKFGPLSAYAVRQHFSSSPAARFSDSTGSIYPLLRRLEAEGLVRSRAADRGRQARREVSATAAGRRVLRRWLSRAPARAELDPPPDSLRIRLYFVGLLPRAEQERFFDETRAGLEERLAAFQAYAAGYAAEGPERISRIAARGGVHATRARIRWLDEARGALLGGRG